MSSPRRRIETDVMKLLMSDYKVELVNDNMQEFHVEFHGPNDTPFQGGIWTLHVELPEQYPYKSPSIGFKNRIFHPNIDEMYPFRLVYDVIKSGSVCLDVINQSWSSMFNLINVLEGFLPQLLRYPNPADPLNSEAAALMTREPKAYEAKVRDYVKKYASKAVHEGSVLTTGGGQDEDDSEVSSVEVYNSEDDDAFGMEL